MRIVAGKYVIAGGFVPKDAEVRTTQSGKSVCCFSVKSSETAKADGTHTAKWLNCVAWGKACDVARYIVKGDVVLVAGELKDRAYTTRDGEERQVSELNCEFAAIMQPPLPPPAFVEAAPGATLVTDLEEVISDDDLPF